MASSREAWNWLTVTFIAVTLLVSVIGWYNRPKVRVMANLVVSNLRVQNETLRNALLEAGVYVVTYDSGTSLTCRDEAGRNGLLVICRLVDSSLGLEEEVVVEARRALGGSVAADDKTMVSEAASLIVVGLQTKLDTAVRIKYYR